jgi:hypothetical protein
MTLRWCRISTIALPVLGKVGVLQHATEAADEIGMLKHALRVLGSICAMIGSLPRRPVSRGRIQPRFNRDAHGEC